MLESLEALYKKHGLYRPSLIRTQDGGASASAYARHFGSLDQAFQKLHAPAHEWAQKTVMDDIRQRIGDVISYHDFLVLGQKLTLSIQPAVPVPSGYAAYWPFCPDRRPVIDITLGVLLSDVKDCDILGYLVLPRWLTRPKSLRFTGNPTHTELWGRRSLDFLDQLLKGKGANRG